MAGHRVKFTFFYVVMLRKSEQCLWYSDEWLIVFTVSFLLNLAFRAWMANLWHRERFWLPTVICIQICKLKAIPINFGSSMRKSITPNAHSED